MGRRGRAATTAGAGALAAGVMAVCFYLLVAGGGKASRDLVVRITEASARPQGRHTVIRITCELENRMPKAASFHPFPDIEWAMQNNLRLRLDGSKEEWRPVPRGLICALNRSKAAQLEPGARKRIDFEISSADFELRREDGAVLSIEDLCASGQAVLARIHVWAYALEKGVEPRFTGTPESYSELKSMEIQVESPSVAVAMTAP